MKLSTFETTLDAVKFFGKALEDCPYTNAATGSELNQNGEIECDACVITSPKIQSGSVAAVKSVKNPILVCTSMLEDSSDQGLSAPRFLAGNGALEYAKIKDLEVGDLVTERSKIAYKYWTERHPVTDTIGVIAMDMKTASACSSSGGSLLKFPGRVGPAAIPGAAVDIKGDSATICSGFGEDILQCGLARLLNCVDILEDGIEELKQYELQRTPYFGALRAQRIKSNVYVDYFHTTEVMNFAILNTKTLERHIYSEGSNSGGWKFSL